MELQALLVLCGVAVAGAAVLLLMGLFSSSGTSYEEAVAQQRRATTELLALAESKNKPKKNAKKANKKLAKKERRTEPAAGAGSEAESEPPGESGADEEPPTLVPAAPAKPHVEFSAAVVVGAPAAQPAVKIRKRKEKVRPILINKEEPPCVSDPSAPPTPAASNHFEESHPKDEFELLQATLSPEKEKEKERASDKKEEAVEKRGKQAKGKQTKQAPEPAREEVKDKQNGDAQPKEPRKAKRSTDKKPQPEEATDPREEAVPPLNPPQPAELTTEKLLKQALASTVAHQPPPPPPPAKKKGKKQDNMLSLMAGDAGGVGVSDLVRLVSEVPLSRTELQIVTDALLNKHHGPLPEHSEWTEGPNDPMQKLKKQLADKEKALADEVEASQALHAKLKELRASLNAERSRLTANARAAEEAAAERHTLQARLHRLTEEHMLLQSKLSAEGEAQAQRVQMEMHIQRLSESETALVSQLQALQAELNARALDAGAARMDAGRAQQHAADLAQQLQDANRMCAELDAQRQNAIMSEQAAQQELRLAQDRLGAFAELQGEAARAAARAQQAEAALDSAKGDLERQKQLAQQASTELSSLREQLSAKESELAELRQLRAAPAQNGLPPGDQHKAAELSKVEGVIESLRAELAAAQRGAQDHKEQLATLQQQINAYQDKNNELRTKNWKVMEALQSAEKSLQTRLHDALPAVDSREAVAKAQEAQYNEVAAVLKSVCPAVAPSTAPSKAWLEAFAAGLKKELQAHRTEVESNKPAVTSQDDSRVTELRAQNEHLQGLVDKYKRIIDDTEGVLSRLQHNVTAEEARWAQQLADKQRELDDKIAQMQKKIESLEAELRQSLAANHNHSFADAERQTEERLLAAGLSEKHKLDSCNGPLQVGLDKK